MRAVIIFVGCMVEFALLTVARADKPPLDHSVYAQWPAVDSRADISADGRYVMYRLARGDDSLPGVTADSKSLVIQSTENAWRKTISQPQTAVFSSDGRTALVLRDDSTLSVVSLGGEKEAHISGVKSWKTPQRENHGWFAYSLEKAPGEVVLNNVSRNTSRRFQNVASYTFEEDGRVLLYEVVDTAASKRLLHWVDLANLRDSVIWEGEKCGRQVFDAEGDRVMFVAEANVSGQRRSSLWHYTKGKARAQQWIDFGAERDLPQTGTVAEFSLKFGREGRYVFFDWVPSKSDVAKSEVNAASLNIWSYKDPRLQPLQLKERANPSEAAFVGLRLAYAHEGHRLIKLAGDTERINDVRGDYAVVERSGYGDRSEIVWNPASRYSVYLVNLQDGSRKALIEDVTRQPYYWLSPSGKYVLYFDHEKRCYVSYETATATLRDVHLGRLIDWTLKQRRSQPNYDYVSGPQGWIPGTDTALVYDEFDIWTIDATGRKTPVNVTAGFGRQHRTVLRFSERPDRDSGYLQSPQDGGYLLIAFNKVSRANGFYRLTRFSGSAPQLLTMGPYLYYLYSWFVTGGVYDRGMEPARAKRARVYIVKRMSATESPNWFVTRDFKTFKAVSDVRPERQYNWLTNEVVRWNAGDGTPLEGILYKPENFDPTKKYPVILHFYEHASDNLNLFTKPRLTGETLDIPWMVSNGYVVLVPDVYYTIGTPGPSIQNCVISAAQHIADQPWAEPRRIGVQGHSFSGYGVNYLVSHSNVFAAAYSGAGASDLISKYLTANSSGGRYLAISETGQTRMGATLWGEQQRYILNSPIFQADKVTTPLLVMHGRNDLSVPFHQGSGWFVALRRLNKKAWMLDYEEGDHSLRGKDALDLNIRIGQFFDHYLKDAPAPHWMTEGVPARFKGIDTGLALDTEGQP